MQIIRHVYLSPFKQYIHPVKNTVRYIKILFAYSNSKLIQNTKNKIKMPSTTVFPRGKWFVVPSGSFASHGKGGHGFSLLYKGGNIGRYRYSSVQYDAEGTATRDLTSSK